MLISRSVCADPAMRLDDAPDVGMAHRFALSPLGVAFKEKGESNVVQKFEACRS